MYIPRYCVQVSIFDSDTDKTIADEGFNTDKIEVIKAKLLEVINILSECNNTATSQSKKL